jgi:hypothetical protein
MTIFTECGERAKETPCPTAFFIGNKRRRGRAAGNGTGMNETYDMQVSGSIGGYLATTLSGPGAPVTILIAREESRKSHWRLERPAKLV